MVGTTVLLKGEVGIETDTGKFKFGNGTTAWSSLPYADAVLSQLINNHIANTSNPHSVTKAQVGLGNVDNTSDANKPISTATQSALNEILAAISTINGKISTTASSSNKLVSASEMGDAIASVEAKQLYKTASQGSFATKAQLTSATTFYNADGSVATPTKNDVAYVLADESHDGKSAKYVIASTSPSIVWGFVIAFSDVTFTQDELNAIRSGITAAKVTSYDSHLTASNPHNITKSTVGLGNVENKSSSTILGELTGAQIVSKLGKTPVYTDDARLNDATTSAHGLMSTTDKTKLNKVVDPSADLMLFCCTLENSVPEA